MFFCKISLPHAIYKNMWKINRAHKTKNNRIEIYTKFKM